MTKPFSSADFGHVFHFLPTRIWKTSCKGRAGEKKLQIFAYGGRIDWWKLNDLSPQLFDSLKGHHSPCALHQRCVKGNHPLVSRMRAKVQCLGVTQAGDSWSEDYFDQRRLSAGLLPVANPLQPLEKKGGSAPKWGGSCCSPAYFPGALMCSWKKAPSLEGVQGE